MSSMTDDFAGRVEAERRERAQAEARAQAAAGFRSGRDRGWEQLAALAARIATFLAERRDPFELRVFRRTLVTSQGIFTTRKSWEREMIGEGWPFAYQRPKVYSGSESGGTMPRGYNVRGCGLLSDGSLVKYYCTNEYKVERRGGRYEQAERKTRWSDRGDEGFDVYESTEVSSANYRDSDNSSGKYQTIVEGLVGFVIDRDIPDDLLD